MATFRTEKINEEIKRELSDIIVTLKDPRIPKILTVMRVDVTKDLKFAKVYVSVYGEEKVQKDAIDGLNSAKAFIRHEIGNKIMLRALPSFSFYLDTSIEFGSHINDVLAKVLPKEGE